MAGEDANGPDDAAWAKANWREPASVSAYLEAFPDGRHAEDARLCLKLVDTLDAIASRTHDPAFVIPFTDMGDQWAKWQNVPTGKMALGFMCQKAGAGVAMGVFVSSAFPVPERFVLFPRGPDGQFVPSTEDGSVLMFKTNGLRYPFTKTVEFQSEGTETLYFGVVKDRGLVYLAGKGSVILNGKEAKTPMSPFLKREQDGVPAHANSGN
jgi:hypothetical protein